MSNKRKNERVFCVVPVDGKEDGIFGHTITIDFSKGGLGFISLKKVPLNKEIPIEIEFSEQEDPVLVLGKVRWVRPLPDSMSFRIGLSFEDILAGSKSRLNAYFQR